MKQPPQTTARLIWIGCYLALGLAASAIEPGPPKWVWATVSMALGAALTIRLAEWVSSQDVRVTPNDLKLSDGGAWRGSCEGGAQKEATDVGRSPERTRRVQARIAATVTRGAVRCSAWLAVFGRLRLKLSSIPSSELFPGYQKLAI